MLHLLAIARGLEPNNPLTYWLFGGWNYEVVRLAGPILADTLFSASLAAGHAAFAKAISLMPDSVVLQYSFARALLMDDPAKNREEAIQTAVQEARGGDVVLIAGKGHEDYQEFADGRIPFDDRKQTRAAMDARRKARGEERS